MKKITILSVKKATTAGWDQAWQDCAYATYFHSREWAEIWNCYTDGRFQPAPRLIVFSDGKKAILPLSIYRQRCKGLIKDYISSPAWTYGGWISSDQLEPQHAGLLAKYLTEKCGNIYWRINPFDKNSAQIKVPSTADTTQIVRLAGGPEVFSREFSRGCIAKVHKSQRLGVTVRVGNSAEDWKEYFQVYENTLERWGGEASSRYEWPLFAEMYRRRSSGIQLWLATYKDKIISGSINFYSRKHAVGWHAATLKEYFDYHPFNLLVAEILADAARQGYACFDLNPSGGHKGVIEFKKGFGSEFVSSPEIIRESLGSMIYNKIDPYLPNLRESKK